MGIPKILHYCWFGGKAMPDEAQANVQGWKAKMPGYEVVRWNESNFDITSCPYVEEAFASGKYAFVSDYARGHSLYHHGGIYMDTDVEVLRPFDDLLGNRSFWGFEAGNFVASSTFGAVPGHEMIRAYLEQYHSRRFIRADGSLDLTTNVEILTRLWQRQGLQLDDLRQTVGDGNLFLPQRYLSPFDYRAGSLANSPEAYAIHHYAKTWLGPWARFKGGLKKGLTRRLGPGLVTSLQKLFARHSGTP